MILAENIRSYYDILSRFEQAYQPTPALSGKNADKAGKKPGPAAEVKRRRAFPSRPHTGAAPPGR